MKKNLFLCLLFLLGILNVSAQTTGNKGFKLNVNSGNAYLDAEISHSSTKPEPTP